MTLPPAEAVETDRKLSIGADEEKAWGPLVDCTDCVKIPLLGGTRIDLQDQTTTGQTGLLASLLSGPNAWHLAVNKKRKCCCRPYGWTY